MRRSILFAAAATMLVAGMGFASAQTSTTTTSTWSNDQGSAFRTYSTTKKYTGFSDPAFKPTVGMELPASATVYALPDTIKVQSPDTYSYTIVNEHPVVVERSSRKIIRTWD
jgi:hypothetical protein